MKQAIPAIAGVLVMVAISLGAVGVAPVAADGAPPGFDREATSPCRIAVDGVSVRQVQRAVGVAADGVLGPATCEAIRSFQCTRNLSVDGVVGPITWAAMQGAASPPGRRICASLTRQVLWYTRDGTVRFIATRMRSGDPRLSNSATTATGNFRVYWKDVDHVSSVFGSAMPYSQFFHGGQAIHGSTFSLPGSHGCINVTMDDARRLWNRTPVGTPVSIWGVRPL